MIVWRNGLGRCGGLSPGGCKAARVRNGRGPFPIIGKQLDQLVGSSRGQSIQNVHQIGEGFHVIQLAGGDQAEVDRGRLAPARTDNFLPVLTSDGYAAMSAPEVAIALLL